MSLFDFIQESRQAFPCVDNRMFLQVSGNRALVVVLNLLFALSAATISNVVVAMVCASRQLYDCDLIMRMKNVLQLSFSLSFGKKLDARDFPHQEEQYWKDQQAQQELLLRLDSLRNAEILSFGNGF